MTPRQVEYMFRIFSQFIAITNEEERSGKETWMSASIFLIATLIKNPDFYNKVGNDSASPKELSDFIEALDFSWDDGKYILKNIKNQAMAFALNTSNKDDIGRILSSIHESELIDDDKPQARASLINSIARMVDDYRGVENQSRFQEIYKSLQSWISFIN